MTTEYFFPKFPRERGTLKETIPVSLSPLIFLFWILISILGSYMYISTSHDMVDDTIKTLTVGRTIKILLILLKSSLGSLSSIFGVMYTNPEIHRLLLGSALLVTAWIEIYFTNNNSYTYFHYYKSLLVIFIPSALFLVHPKIFRKVNFLGQKMILNPINLGLLSIPPVLIVLCGFWLHPSTVLLPSTSSITLISLGLTFSSLVIYSLYYKNRSHKNGGLLDVHKLANYVVSGLSILASFLIWCKSFHDIETLLPILIGSTLTLILCGYFLFIADVWYPIGTGQFQMICLDSIGLFLCFILPIILLHIRFMSKYGDIIDKTWMSFLSFPAVNFLSNNNRLRHLLSEELHNISIIFMMTIAIIIGIPLLNNLCPLCGHLYGKVYTHGQPNTKKFALCVLFCDLFNNKTSDKDRDLLWKILHGYQQTRADKNTKTSKKNKTLVKTIVKNQSNNSTALNIFITLNDLEKYPAIIRDLVEMGHFVGLTLSTIASTYHYNTLIHKSREKFVEVTGNPPLWIKAISHPSSNAIWTPSTFRNCRDLGMRVAFCSTYIEVSQECLSSTQVNSIVNDIIDKRGGSFIYISANQTIRLKGMGVVLSLCLLLEDLYKNEKCQELKPCSIQVVAKEHPLMTL